LYALAAIVGVSAAVRARSDWRNWLIGAWFALPIMITLAVSLVKPVFVPRYLIVSLPALVLLVAAGICSFRKWWITIPGLAVVCWLAMGGTLAYYHADFDLAREDCRGATEYVLQNAQPGDAIVFHKEQNRFAYSYYASHIGGSRPQI